MTSVPQSRLRLDRSRYFSTVHGERAPDDPHRHAHFVQDGIHFDSHGLHIDELIDDDKLRALLDRKLKKQGKAVAKDAEPADDDDGADAGGAGDAGGGSEEVNLESWLRGEAKYAWFAITKTVRERYSNNLTKQIDVIEFLVFDVKLVPEDQLGADIKSQLRPKQ